MRSGTIAVGLVWLLTVTSVSAEEHLDMWDCRDGRILQYSNRNIRHHLARTAV